MFHKSNAPESVRKREDRSWSVWEGNPVVVNVKLMGG